MVVGLFSASKPIVPFGTSLKKSLKRHAILLFSKKLLTLPLNLNHFSIVFSWALSENSLETYGSVRDVPEKVEKALCDIAVCKTYGGVYAKPLLLIIFKSMRGCGAPERTFQILRTHHRKPLLFCRSKVVRGRG